MKYKLKITVILLTMFLITQFIGLAVLHADPFHIEQEVNGTIQKVSNPALSWIQPPEVKENVEFIQILVSIIIAFVIAISLLFLLTKFKIKFFLKAWFFVVVSFALWIAIYSFEILLPWVIPYKVALIVPILIAVPFAFMKIFGKNFVVHNATELLIYPGIAAVFVPILNVWTISILLILISIYDIWAVWHSGLMIKMAKYQMNELNIFGGFLIPFVSKKVKEQIKKMKKSELKKKKIKVNVAILGGGDVVFPIIAAGVMFLKYGLLSALFVIAGATLGLTYLFFFAKKKKYYPAMPFITSGIFAGMIASWIIL